MKENSMNTQVNGSALDPRDIHVPSQEPMVAAMASPRAAAETDDAMDDNRREEITAQGPALPLYLAEKYYWKRSKGGKLYLSPLPGFLSYVETAAARAADYGIGLVYPGGEHGKTDESDLVATIVEHSKEMLHALRAVNENEGKAFERYLVERCMRNSVYAATTQFELENWAARAHARGQDANSHPNYAEKESRLSTFALQAGVAFAIAREVVTDEPLNATTFAKAARRVVFEAANFEGDKLLTPQQLSDQQKAEADATVKLARRF